MRIYIILSDFEINGLYEIFSLRPVFEAMTVRSQLSQNFYDLSLTTSILNKGSRENILDYLSFAYKMPVLQPIQNA